MAPSLVMAGYLSIGRIVCAAGEFDDVLGGGLLYAALAAAEAGVEVHLCATVAADYPPQALAILSAAGVNLEHIRRAPCPARRYAIAALPCGSDPASADHQLLPTAEIWWQQTRTLAPVPLSMAADGYVVMAMPGDVAMAHARQGRALGSVVVADMHPIYVRAARHAFIALAEQVHAFTPSRTSLSILFPAADEAAIQAELRARAAIVLQKRSCEGYWLSTPSTPLIRVERAGHDGVDCTGSDAAAVGGLAAGLVMGLDPEAALELASTLASRACQAVGPGALGMPVPLPRRG